MKNNKILALLLLGGVTLTGCVKNNENADDNNVPKTEQTESKEENNTSKKEDNTAKTDNNADKSENKDASKKADSIEKEPRYGTTIKIGFDGGLCMAGQNLADINGYYKDRGIDVKFVNTKNGKDALSSGQIDVMTGEFGSLIVPATKGLNYVFSTASHSGCKSLYVLDEKKEFQKTSDLIGKDVAVTNGIGNGGHNTLIRFLIHDDIDPDDVNVKPVDQSAVIQSLESGEIQGAVLDDQFAQEFLKSGKIRPIRSLTNDDDFGKEVCCVTAFNKDFVDENPMLAEVVGEAIEKGNEYAQENPEESVKLLQENNMAEGDQDVAIDLLKAYDYSLKNKDGEETIRSYFDDYKEAGIIDDSKSTDDLVKELWRPLGNGEVEVVSDK
jgi:ABC-type nitrate/sulfonate/bicarbonate transport systems periplasmic components-like protein